MVHRRVHAAAAQRHTLASSPADTTLGKKIDANSWDFDLKKDGKVVGHTCARWLARISSLVRRPSASPRTPSGAKYAGPKEGAARAITAVPEPLWLASEPIPLRRQSQRGENEKVTGR
jgi:hypothetical protein